MNKPFTYFFILLMLFCCEAKTQTNLVPDYSFEDTTKCPLIGNTINYSSSSWFTENIFGTADHFCSCSNKDSITIGFPQAGVPNNLMGNQNALTGNCYAGFMLNEGGFNYKEYISVKLKKTLIAGMKYSVSFNINLADSCIYAVKSLGCLFTPTPFTKNVYGIPSLIPQIKITSNNFYSDKVNWTLLQDTNYIANGTEQYITIGSFETSILDTTSLNFPHTFIPGDGNEYNTAYYYIDDVQLLEKESSILIANVFTPNNDGVNDVWRCDFSAFENVNCSIYNRWGNLIFQSNKQIIQWDGRTTTGINCEDGIYFYCIETDTEKYKGHIQLIR